LERLGGEGENPQRVIVPNDDDDGDDYDDHCIILCYLSNGCRVDFSLGLTAA